MSKKPELPILKDKFTYIDRDALDEEWDEQPRKTFFYGEKLAEATYDFSVAKAKFELTEAELELEIMKRPKHYGLTKTTGQVVKACIITQDEYQITQKRMNIAKYKMDTLKAAVSSLEARKKALEDHVKLIGMQYYGEPRAKGVGKEVANEIMRKKTRKVLEEEE